MWWWCCYCSGLKIMRSCSWKQVRPRWNRFHLRRNTVLAVTVVGRLRLWRQPTLSIWKWETRWWINPSFEGGGKEALEELSHQFWAILNSLLKSLNSTFIRPVANTSCGSSELEQESYSTGKLKLFQGWNLHNDMLPVGAHCGEASASAWPKLISSFFLGMKGFGNVPRQFWLAAFSCNTFWLPPSLGPVVPKSPWSNWPHQVKGICLPQCGWGQRWKGNFLACLQ